ncbi:MAG: hypothetical protein AB7I34_16950 [Rhizobiaceae bacterium]
MTRVLVVIRFIAMLVIAGLMAGMALALAARLGRDGVRRSSPNHAARNEGERNEQD